jgi:hypothetical protein
LPKKSHEISASYSLVPYYDKYNKESQVVSNHIGLHWAYGIHPYINTRIRYEVVIPKYEYASPVHFISLGGKFPIVSNYLAGYVPFGFYLGEGLQEYNRFVVHPTLIATLPVRDILNVNVSLSAHFYFEKIDNIIALTTGVDILRIMKYFTFRPEFGVAINPKIEGFYYSFNMGISFNLIQTK